MWVWVFGIPWELYTKANVDGEFKGASLLFSWHFTTHTAQIMCVVCCCIFNECEVHKIDCPGIQGGWLLKMLKLNIKVGKSNVMKWHTNHRPFVVFRNWWHELSCSSLLVHYHGWSDQCWIRFESLVWIIWQLIVVLEWCHLSSPFPSNASSIDQMGFKSEDWVINRSILKRTK